MADYRMQLQAAVRLGAVEEDGHCGNRDMRECESEDDIPPPRHRQQAMGEERQKILIHLEKDPKGTARSNEYVAIRLGTFYMVLDHCRDIF